MAWPVRILLGQLAGIVLADAVRPEASGLRAGALGLATLGPLCVRGRIGRGLLVSLLAAFAGAHALVSGLDPVGSPGPRVRSELVVEARPCGRPPFGHGLVLCEPVARRAPGSTPDEATPLPRRLLVWARGGSEESAALARVADARRVRARLRVEGLGGPRNPGAPDRTRALERRGIGGRAHLVAPEWIVSVEVAGEVGPAPIETGGATVAGLRERIARRLAITGGGGALLAALAVGDRSRLSPAVREAFARLGIAHLLAVSGLHVALAMGIAFAATRRLVVVALTNRGVADPRAVCAVVAWVSAGGYALLAGGGVPLQRAWIGAGLGVSAFVLRRSATPGRALAVAAIVVLALDPAAAFDAGPQLSFAAVGALLAASRSRFGGEARLHGGHFVRVGANVLTSVRTATIALAATAPVLAAHGMTTGGLGIVANVIAVPLTAALLMPCAGLAAAVAAAAPPHPLVETSIAGLAWPAARLVDGAVAAVGQLPPAARDGPVGVLAVGVGIALAAVAVRTGREGVRVALVLALTVWLVSVPGRPVAPLPPRVVALDVGQGDALLVEGRRAAVLIDGGLAVPGIADAGDRVVVPALSILGVAFLDVVVASHADVDHRGGLEAVLRQIPAGALWLPLGARGDPAFTTLISIARERDVAIREVGAGTPTTWVGDLEIEILWPPPAPTSSASNDRSIVARIRVDGDAVLLTGDIGHEVERRLSDNAGTLAARVLKVAHHGSDGSTSRAFLEAVAPEIALVSAGCGAASGLPREGVLEAIRRRGVRLYWTGRDGATLLPLGRGAVGGSVRTWADRRDCGH